MQRSPRLSPYGLIALLSGAVISTATTCGPPDPVGDTVPIPVDTGEDWPPPSEPEVGFTVIEEGTVDLRGVGDVVERTVRVTLSERCLTEVPEYGWGYPTGWIVFAYELTAGAGDTGGDSGGGDSGVDTAPADTADTATSAADDTAADTATTDTAAVDTGAVDTGAVDTGEPVDTGAPDTAAPVDTGWGDTGGPPSDARVLVEVIESDGGTLGDARVRLFGEATTRDSLTTERPYATCARDAACEAVWTMRFTLVEGEAVHGDLDAHVRLNLCSSGDPQESDLAVVIE